RSGRSRRCRGQPRRATRARRAARPNALPAPSLRAPLAGIAALARLAFTASSLVATRRALPSRLAPLHLRVAARADLSRRSTRLRLAGRESPEAADAAHLADGRVLRRAALERRAEHAAHLRRVLDDPLFAERLDRGDADRARERMAAVCEAAGEVLVLQPCSDRLAHRHRAE